MQKSILCYGDSNTWGYEPIKFTNKDIPKKRYPRQKRWTGILQNLLGTDYYIIEEGLNGRTTNLEYANPDRNGKTYLPPCLYSHAPVDLVILALGGNDLKSYFNRTPAQIKDGLAELVDIIQLSKFGPNLQDAPKLLILSLTSPRPNAEEAVDENGIYIFQGAIEKAKTLTKLYEILAQEKGCYFLDISKNIKPSETDGLHLDEITHQKLALILAEKINNIL